MDCSHPFPELCSELGRHVHGRLLELWHTRADYRDAWCRRAGVDLHELERRFPPGGSPESPQLPPLLTRALNFGKAVTRDLLAGSPRLDDPDAAARLAVCESCPSFLPDRRACADCGCPVDTKVSWALERCPRDLWPNLPTTSTANSSNLERNSSRHGLYDWAVGITTASRRDPTLADCVSSWRAAGWEPAVFAEPGTDVSGLPAETPVVTRSRRLGAWHNWIQTVRDLLRENPDAEVILAIQDDAVVSPGARRLVERDLWPYRAGFVSLYCPAHYSKGRGPGLRNVLTDSMWGALAIAFPRDVAERVVDHPIAKNWKGVSGNDSGPNIKNVDTAIGQIVHGALGLNGYWYMNPSLVRHVAKHSTIGGRGNTGNRQAAEWSGRSDLAESNPYEGREGSACCGRNSP